MAVKVVIWSCLVAFLGYFTYQELTVVTESFSLQTLVPAKKTDVFHFLINPENFLKVHPLCVSVTNVTRSQGKDGTETIQYVNQERIKISLGIYETSRVITFGVTVTVMHEKVVIKNRIDVMGGILKIRQRWHVADSANGSRDDIALLKNRFEITAIRLFTRFAKREAIDAHSIMIENIRQHFLEASKESANDKS